MNIRKDIAKKISSFYHEYQDDNHHRYMSWEHCYGYFKRDAIDIDIDKACLHLAFYLASWGMYRGSSFLLQKDYLIHKDVVKYLIAKKHLQNIEFKNISDEGINEIIRICVWIREWYARNIRTVNGVVREVNATDTLVTKIVLGTLGCIPAYDSCFIDGLRIKGIRPFVPTLSGVKKLVSFYTDNIDQFDVISSEIIKSRKIIYPPMKLVDMYFWQIGYNDTLKSLEKI